MRAVGVRVPNVGLRIPVGRLRRSPGDERIAASSGASTRELMHRRGHASMRAALIYQHATGKRDRQIPAAIDERIGRGSDS